MKSKTVVITGTLSIARAAAINLITRRGGVVRNEVSAATDFLVVGNEPGSKLKRAKKLGVTTLTERQLMNRVAR